MNKIRTHSTHIQGQPDMRRRRKRVSRVIGIALVTAFALAACTAPAPSDTSQPAEGATSVEMSPAPDSTSGLPLDFQIAVYQGQELLGGNEVDFSGVLGQGKPVVLNFWAGLCPPCRIEMPDFQAVHEEFGDEILLVGVDVGTFTGLGNEQDGRALLQEVGVTYPTGTTANPDVMRAYQVIGMPTTVFLKPNGEVHQRWTGLLTQEKLEELVQDLLEAS